MIKMKKSISLIAFIIVCGVVVCQDACYRYDSREFPKWPSFAKVSHRINVDAENGSLTLRAEGLYWVEGAYMMVRCSMLNKKDPYLVPDAMSSGTTGYNVDQTHMMYPPGSIFSNHHYKEDFWTDADGCKRVNITVNHDLATVMTEGCVVKEQFGPNIFYRVPQYISYASRSLHPTHEVVWRDYTEAPFIFEFGYHKFPSIEGQVLSVYFTRGHTVDPFNGQIRDFTGFQTTNNSMVVDLVVKKTKNKDVTFYMQTKKEMMHYSEVEMRSVENVQQKSTLLGRAEMTGKFCLNAKKNNTDPLAPVCDALIPLHFVDKNDQEYTNGGTTTGTLITPSIEVIQGPENEMENFKRTAEQKPFVVGTTPMWLILLTNVSRLTHGLVKQEIRYTKSGGEIEPFEEGDYQTYFTSDQLPLNFDPTIKNSDKLWLAYRFHPSDHLRRIFETSGRLDINMVIEPKERSNDQAFFSGIILGASTTPLEETSALWKHVAIGLLSALTSVLLIVAIVGSVFIFKHHRKKKSYSSL